MFYSTQLEACKRHNPAARAIQDYDSQYANLWQIFCHEIKKLKLLIKQEFK